MSNEPNKPAELTEKELEGVVGGAGAGLLQLRGALVGVPAEAPLGVPAEAPQGTATPSELIEMQSMTAMRDEVYGSL